MGPDRSSSLTKHSVTNDARIELTAIRMIILAGPASSNTAPDNPSDVLADETAGEKLHEVVDVSVAAGSGAVALDADRCR
jgi:hypothetical protein